MTYPEQLQTENWKQKRQEILIRDKNTCQNCNNENLINEFKKGLFSGYCFPTNKNAIRIDGIGKKRFLRAGIDEKYCKLLSKSTFVYSKKIPKWKRMVLGLRNPTKLELNILEEYHPKIEYHFKQYIKTHDFSLLNKANELNNEKLNKLEKLKDTKNISDLNWILMLGLHIHHKYYVNGLLAWEYDNDALITLCQTCHEKLHKNQQIKVYNNEFELLGYYKYCSRCHGAGVFPEYSHVQNGICFKCNGLRYEELIANTNNVHEK